MHQIINKMISVLYPRRCAVCDECILDTQLVCPECMSRIGTISGSTCMKCGKKLDDDNRMYCFDCSRKIHWFDRGFAVFEYEAIRRSLYRFKYSGRAEYAAYYAWKTNELLGNTLAKIGVEALIPVPIHSSRMRMRGYNQAQVYAVGLSKLTKIPVIEDWVVRVKKTRPLKELGMSERQKNLKKAFKLRRNDVKLSRVCVIDDIYTTGATIDEISRLLKAAGVAEVYFVTIAIGNGL